MTKQLPFKYVQIFENKGTAMGCSNLHPHGQAWCLESIPSEVSQELKSFDKYKREHNIDLFADYVKLESREKSRVVVENESFIVVVPYWAIWPFETLVISKKKLASISQFNQMVKEDLASILKQLTIKYDNLFKGA